MNINLQEFFKLNGRDDLFKLATQPKSFGGTDEYEKLAREGDILLNNALMKIYENEPDTGVLNRKMSSIHSRRCLVQLSAVMKIDQSIKNHDPTREVSEKDVKETIEALLGVSAQINSFNEILEIVKSLLEIIEKFDLFDSNPKGRLLELYQANQYTMPEFLHVRVGGPDNNPIWRCKIKDIFFGTNKTFVSEEYSNKKDAEQNAAQKFLFELDLVEKPSFYTPPDKIAVKSIKETIPKQSLLFDDIIFTNSESSIFNEKITIPQGTGELIKDWIKRKQAKDPFGLVLLLCSRFKEIRGKDWYASLEIGELVLLNMEIDNVHYFAIDLGSSKTQARKNCATKIIIDSKIIEWIEKKFPKEEI